VSLLNIPSAQILIPNCSSRFFGFLVLVWTQELKFCYPTFRNFYFEWLTEFYLLIWSPKLFLRSFHKTCSWPLDKFSVTTSDEYFSNLSIYCMPNTQKFWKHFLSRKTVKKLKEHFIWLREMFMTACWGSSSCWRHSPCCCSFVCSFVRASYGILI
jgi:hypothetical protein